MAAGPPGVPRQSPEAFGPHLAHLARLPWPALACCPGRALAGPGMGQLGPVVAPFGGLWPRRLSANLTPELLNCRLHPARSVRNAQGLEAHLHGSQGAQHHGRVGVSHMGDAESLAVKLSKSHTQDHAALLTGVIE